MVAIVEYKQKCDTYNKHFVVQLILIFSITMAIVGITMISGTAGFAITVSGIVLACEAYIVLKNRSSR